MTFERDSNRILPGLFRSGGSRLPVDSLQIFSFGEEIWVIGYEVWMYTWVVCLMSLEVFET
jgi:hypothetical protein